MIKNKNVLIIFISLCALFLFSSFINAQVVNRFPWGVAVPRLYDITTRGNATTISLYYLDVPTLTGNDTLATLTHTQTFTNKTLTSPTITSPTITTPDITQGTFSAPYLYDPNFAGTPKITGTTGTLKLFVYHNASFSDDATTDLPNASTGIVWITAEYDATNDAQAMWFVGADANCKVTAGKTAYIDDASTDNTLCVFDNGTACAVANRMDETADLSIFMIYHQ